MIQKKRAIITDLDGTLIRDDHTISEKDFNSLVKLKNRFIRIIATGKSLYSYERTFGKRPNFVDYMVFSNGAAVLDCNNDTIIEKRELDSSNLNRLKSYLENSGFDYMIQTPLDKDFKLHIKKNSNYINSDFEARKEYYKESITLEEYNYSYATQVVIIIPKEYFKEEIYENFKTKFKDLSVIKSTSPMDHKSIWIEFCNKEVSKSQGIIRLSEDFNFDVQNSMIIGNDYNDLEMLKLTKYGYLVNNAPKKLHNMGFNIVSSNNENGVSMAIDNYLKEISFE